jgi:hypothetical protein
MTHICCNRLATLDLRRKLPTLPLLFAAALCTALVMLPPVAKAANTWHVSPNSAGACTLADPNCATIQAAVTTASAGDTIQVTAGTYKENVVIGKDITINGAGAAQTVVDGTQTNRVFTINGVTVSLSGMTVANGKTTGDGGGVNNSGTLSITNCIISNNAAESSGIGGVNDGGGGIINSGTLAVTNSTIGNNSALQGGGIFNNGGTATITNSIVSGNTATSSSGEGGGILNSAGMLNVINSTFSNNSINNSINNAGFGGGICNSTAGTLNVTNSTFNNNLAGFGGGINDLNATMAVTGSTFSNNFARFGGGIFTQQDNVAVTSSTFSGNSGFGGGIDNNGGAVSVASSIIAGNTTTTSSPDLRGTFTSHGHNLVGKSDGSTGFTNGANGDIVGTASAPVDAKLSPLGFYGGPTQTQLLLCGSPAIDAGDDSVTAAPLSLSTEQRGAARKSGAHVDIGAVERQQGFQVNSQDSGPGSLRQLIADAQDGAVIDLDCASAVTVTLTSGELPINKNLTINGPGPTLLTVKRSAAQGTPDFRIFEVVTGKTVSLSGMTVGNGKASDVGGGILNNSGATLNVTSCTVTNNSVGNGGNGGGGISNSGTLNVTSCTVSNNSAGTDGGGIDNEGLLTVTNSVVSNNSAITGGLGGGIVNGNHGTASITNSTISNNTATGGGGLDSLGTMNVTNSTVSNNNCAGGGGGIGNDGLMTVTNSTVSNNTASSDEGGGIFNLSVLTVTSSTISGNSITGSAGSNFSGGGINNFFGATTTVRSSIIAGNTSTTAPDIDGNFTSKGHNLIGASDDSAGFANGTNGDIVGTKAAPVDPQLFPLANYGGPTQTQLPRPSSPAIDAGDDTVLNPPLNLSTDQRGFARQVGSHVDIGAVEFNAATDPLGGIFQFSAATYTVSEGGGHIDITVTRTAPLTQASAVDFATADNDPAHLLPCSAAGGNASSRCDYEATSGTLQFAPGDTSKTFTVLINEDAFVEGPETLKLVLSNPAGGSALGQQSTATLQITDDDTTPPTTNPIDDAQFFVTQHYHDFLNREPDASGLQFWTSGITSCGSDANCVAVKRVNTSAAFFLSIEFQETGFLVERMYKTAFGDATGNSTLGGAHQLSVPVVRFAEFMRDTQEVRSTPNQIVVGQGNWQQQLEDNKNAFALDFVQRQRFTNAFPSTLTADAFVNQLNTNAGGVMTASDISQLDGIFGGPSASSNDPAKRAQALRAVAENATLKANETNRAFVLMQYFGYLRRNPDDAPDADYTGYDFWLTKLNQFNGNFVQAEMVKAFITSAEYRQRFGQ